MRRLLVLLALIVIVATFPTAALAAKPEFKVSVNGTQTDTLTGGGEEEESECKYTTSAAGKSKFTFSGSSTEPLELGSSFMANIALSVKASGSYSFSKTLSPGQKPDCFAGVKIEESCPNIHKSSRFNATFVQGNILSVGIGVQDLMLKRKCPEWGRFSGLAGLLRKKVVPSKLSGAKTTTFSSKATESRNISGLGPLKSTFDITVKLTRID